MALVANYLETTPKSQSRRPLSPRTLSCSKVPTLEQTTYSIKNNPETACNGW